MKLEQFRYFLDAYGASFARWPEERRAEAEAILAGSPAAAAALAEARSIDAALDRVPVARDEAAEGRVVMRAALAARIRPERRAFPLLDKWLAPLWTRAALVAAVALLVVASGSLEMEQSANDSAWPDYVQGPSDVGPIELADL